MAISFIAGGNRRTRETTDLSQVTEKLYHIRLYTSSWSWFELITSVKIGIGSCKSNNHTIMTTMVPHYNLRYVWTKVGIQGGLLLQKMFEQSIYCIQSGHTIAEMSERSKISIRRALQLEIGLNEIFYCRQ